ncbi:hypothetical protein HU762_24635 [Pseudomonas sp. SWRI92]|uniref:Lipoprotein n=1 Tax=Pseudomonas marvdashtae TaxID=2745500 RepID=A0A923JQ43_9PSED|nr:MULTISPECIES: hypothetical protein [Pseudomonas]MBC3377132.1 hypothetical protein [Pseudomonas sp. SWRI92]MBV4552581.1 hypothetical protein [Pseudomonas marvdashtae]
MKRLILSIAFMALAACASQPTHTRPVNAPVLKFRAVPVTADGLPVINPDVLKSIEQLNMPAPVKTLTYIELAGTVSFPKESRPERTEYFLSTDPTTRQLRMIHKSEHLNGSKISWRGLLTLSGLEQADLSRNTAVIDSLSFRGDWQHMPVGSQLGFTRQGSNTSNIIGTLGTEPKVVNCRIDRELPAKQLNPALSGQAKAMSCQEQRPSTSPVPFDHYFYLVDYGFFYRASNDKHDGVSIDMHIQRVK